MQVTANSGSILAESLISQCLAQQTQPSTCKHQCPSKQYYAGMSSDPDCIVLFARALLSVSSWLSLLAKALQSSVTQPLFAVTCTLLEVPPFPVISLQGDCYMGSPTIRPINPVPESAVKREERTLIADVAMTVYDSALQAIVNPSAASWASYRKQGAAASS